MTNYININIESDAPISSSGYSIDMQSYSGANKEIASNWLYTLDSGCTDNGVVYKMKTDMNMDVNPRYADIRGCGFGVATPKITVTQHRHPNYYNLGDTYICLEKAISGTSSLDIGVNGGRIAIRTYAITNHDITQHCTNSDYFTFQIYSGSVAVTQVGNVVETDEYIQWLFDVDANQEFQEKDKVFKVFFKADDDDTISAQTTTVTLTQKAKEHTYEEGVITLDKASLTYKGGIVNFQAYYIADGEKKPFDSITFQSASTYKEPLNVNVSYIINQQVSSYCTGYAQVASGETNENRTFFLRATYPDSVASSIGSKYIDSSNVIVIGKPDDNYVFKVAGPDDNCLVSIDSKGCYTCTTHVNYDETSETYGILSQNNGVNCEYKVESTDGDYYDSYTASTTGDCPMHESGYTQFTVNLKENPTTAESQVTLILSQITEGGVEMPKIKLIIYKESKLSYRLDSEFSEFKYMNAVIGMDFMTGTNLDVLANVPNSTASYHSVGEDSDIIYSASNTEGDTIYSTLRWGNNNNESIGNERILWMPSSFITELSDKSLDTKLDLYAKVDSYIGCNRLICAELDFINTDSEVNVISRPKNVTENVFQFPDSTKTSINIFSQLNDSTDKSGINAYSKIVSIIKYNSDGRWFVHAEPSTATSLSCPYDQNNFINTYSANTMGASRLGSGITDVLIDSLFGTISNDTNQYGFYLPGGDSLMVLGNNTRINEEIDDLLINYNRTVDRLIGIGIISGETSVTGNTGGTIYIPTGTVTNYGVMYIYADGTSAIVMDEPLDADLTITIGYIPPVGPHKSVASDYIHAMYLKCANNKYVFYNDSGEQKVFSKTSCSHVILDANQSIKIVLIDYMTLNIDYDKSIFNEYYDEDNKLGGFGNLEWYPQPTSEKENHIYLMFEHVNDLASSGEEDVPSTTIIERTAYFYERANGIDSATIPTIGITGKIVNANNGKTAQYTISSVGSVGSSYIRTISWPDISSSEGLDETYYLDGINEIESGQIDDGYLKYIYTGTLVAANSVADVNSKSSTMITSTGKTGLNYHPFSSNYPNLIFTWSAVGVVAKGRVSLGFINLTRLNIGDSNPNRRWSADKSYTINVSEYVIERGKWSANKYVTGETSDMSAYQLVQSTSTTYGKGITANNIGTLSLPNTTTYPESKYLLVFRWEISDSDSTTLGVLQRAYYTTDYSNCYTYRYIQYDLSPGPNILDGSSTSKINRQTYPYRYN